MYRHELETKGFVTAGTVSASLLAAASVTFALFSASFIQKALAPKQIHFSKSSSVFWWAQESWGVEKVEAQEWKAFPELPKPIENRKKMVRRKLAVTSKKIARSSDRLRSSRASAVVAAPSTTLIQESPPVVSSSPSVSSDQKAAGLLNVWKALRKNFVVALNPPKRESEIVTEVAQLSTQSPLMDKVSTQIQVVLHPYVPKEDYFFSSQLKFRAKRVHAQVLPDARVLRSGAPQKTEVNTVAKSIEKLAQLVEKASQRERDSTAREQNSNPAPLLVAGENQSPSSFPGAIRESETHEYPTVVSAASPLRIIAANPAPRDQSTLSTQGDQTAANEQWNRTTRGSALNHGEKSETRTDPTQTKTPVDGSSGGQSAGARHCEYSTSAKFIDAFDSNQDLSLDTQIQCWTQSTKQNWLLTQRPLHYPTLFLNDADLTTHSIPLMSYNNAYLMSRMLNVSIQKQMGLIVGRVPEGYTVSFSGRSEEVLYFAFDPLTQTVRRTETSNQERFFLLLNASPGAQMIYLMSGKGETRSAVAVPVNTEMATYLDLTGLAKGDIQGSIVRAGKEKKTGVAKATISQAGLTERAVSTNEDGSFFLKSVDYVKGYPIYLEAVVQTQNTNDFVHRYAIDPRSAEERELFYFSSSEITAWISQLEGGVSSESGLLFAAFPKVTSQLESKISLIPEIQSMGQQHLSPEAYTWDKEGKLIENVEISTQNQKMMLVQVAAGAHVLKLKHSVLKDVAWSDLIYTSPGVVNVVVE